MIFFRDKISWKCCGFLKLVKLVKSSFDKSILVLISFFIVDFENPDLLSLTWITLQTQHKKLEKWCHDWNIYMLCTVQCTLLEQIPNSISKIQSGKINYLYHWLSKIETSETSYQRGGIISHHRIIISAKGCVTNTKFLRCFTEYIHVNRSKILHKIASFHRKFL